MTYDPQPGDRVDVWLETAGPSNTQKKDPHWTRCVEGEVVRGLDEACTIAVHFVIDEDNYDDWVDLMGSDAPISIGESWTHYEVCPDYTAVEYLGRRVCAVELTARQREVLAEELRERASNALPSYACELERVLEQVESAMLIEIPR